MELSNTLKYINLTGVSIGLVVYLTGVSIGLVVLCGPMHLRVCVSKKPGDGEGVGSYASSDYGVYY